MGHGARVPRPFLYIESWGARVVGGLWHRGEGAVVWCLVTPSSRAPARKGVLGRFKLPDRCAHTPLLRRWHPRHRDPNQSLPPTRPTRRSGILRVGMSPKQGRNPPALVENVPQTGSEYTGACGGAAPELHVPALVPPDRVRSGIQTCTVRSQMSQSHVPIQNSQYVALSDDFCILVAPESDFPDAPCNRCAR